ncbi:11S globulin subunit beta-like [Papaver somniferum]|uniref:11S globulin subunit beta-like n=1 Tax=Papaver somniferum TaxID=3469 RepID=UPI000E704271|nr:11S globulin subunit beta-like [Papaver somniferum]
MENLSSHVVLEILSRLPKTREGIKSSLQCRKVCGLWRNLLGKPKTGMLFAVMPRYHWDIKLYYKEQSTEMLNFKCTEKQLDFYETITDIRTMCIRERDFSLVGSCNGLVCYRTHDYTLGIFIYILNPITGEQIRLPKMVPYCKCAAFGYCPSINPFTVPKMVPYCGCAGFGYCHSTNVYKIVQICFFGNSKGRVVVYTLGDGMGWRELGKTTYEFLESGIFAHGALYWLNKKSKYSVVAFDLEDETFQDIPSPPCHHIPSDSYMKVILGSLGGNLYMLRSYYKEGERMMDVFIFKKKNMNDCATRVKERAYFNSYRWINVFRGKWDSDLTQNCQLLSLTESEILLFQNGVLSCYHPTTFKKIWYAYAGGDFCQSIPYMHTVVSLKYLGEELVDCEDPRQIEQQGGGWQTQQQQQQSRHYQGQSQCRIENINAQEPNRRVESEAGVVEFWDQNNEQFECAGVAPTRYIIQPNGLLLPFFVNAPRLVYIVQGRGMSGALIPGCPETFHSIRQSAQLRAGRSQQQGARDQHQKIRSIRQGDILALPAGVTHWLYNEGETPLVAVSLHDTSSNANQLDRNLRRFQLAGSQQTQTTSYQQRQQQRQQVRGQQQDIPENNIFNGFNVETLAEAFGVSTETARKLQGQNDQRGNIVFVEGGLRAIRPQQGEDEEEREQRYRTANGVEETICSMRLKQNIANPTRADIYSEKGGRITTLNSQKLPILNFLQMSAERGVLYQNALHAPHWHSNAHSVIYVTRGSCRCQIVGNQGRQVFDGQLNQGQMLVVPQNFAVVKQAGNEGFEWVSFKTNDNAMAIPLVGKTSVLRAMPVDVLMNAYQISREEAQRLKYNRQEETMVLTPGSRSQVRASA